MCRDKNLTLAEKLKELESEFGNAKSGHCGKEFHRTYFNICGDCLVQYAIALRSPSVKSSVSA